VTASSEHLVSLERCATYDQATVDDALDRLLAPLGGMGAFVSAGQRVMLKVNLLTKAEPDRAVTTHPALVRAVVRAVKAAGASDVAIGDSPGGRTTAASARALFELSGMTAVAHEEGARLVLLDDEVVRRPAPGGLLYQSFNLGREAVDADVLIDLPRLKTHGFMMMTGAVKNLFGCIPGLEKAQFHLKVPDRDDFADMLVDLLLACRPALSIMDAVVGMEGDGPSGGTPKPVGALLASADAVALDIVAAAIAGFGPMEVYTNAAAHRRGLGPRTVEEVETTGADWREVAPASFAHPARDITRGMPPGIAKWIRARVSSRPVLARPEACTACKTCEKNCPVDAVTVTGKRPTFDYDACIRCYCCQELCPERALDLRSPWFARAVVMRGGSKQA
jgi:uncharacterized protein (DUF362 family)/Pyruvate/2-oxoacid:ferredoxin oxidoreductase delta subunit